MTEAQNLTLMTNLTDLFYSRAMRLNYYYQTNYRDSEIRDSYIFIYHVSLLKYGRFILVNFQITFIFFFLNKTILCIIRDNLNQNIYNCHAHTKLLIFDAARRKIIFSRPVDSKCFMFYFFFQKP